MAIQVLTKDGLTYYHSKLKEVYLDDIANKVDKVDGKGLSTNDYTTAEKEKLAAIAAGAQVNVIESVKVDGVALSVTDKAVNIDLSGFATKAEVSAIPKFAIKFVDALPTEDISTSTIYLVPNAGSGTNARDEYVYVDGAWEMLGTTEVDLSDYAKSADVTAEIENATKDMATSATIATINQNIESIQNTMATDDEVAAVKTALQGEIDADVKVVSDALGTYKTENNAAVALKADASAVYTKAEVFTKTEVESAIGTATADMATDSELAAVDAKFANYVLSADVTTVSNAEIDSMFA